MAIFEHQHESVEEPYDTELGYLKLMLLCRVPIAVPAAMYHCNKYGLDAPRRLIIESVTMHCAHLGRNVPKKRGRSSGIINRYRQDAIDYIRWEAVTEVCERRDLLRKEIEELRALRGRRARDILNERAKLLQWVEPTRMMLLNAHRSYSQKRPRAAGLMRWTKAIAR